MATGQLDKIIHHLRRTALRRQAGALSDGQLLGRFLAHRDQDAFAALVDRHGAMVLGVCRRVLGDAHDAEDAFQATFLVLVRKAASLRSRELVGNWLYGVAYRTSLEARARSARRRAREQQVRDMPHTNAEPNQDWQDLRPLLDRELSRLPDKYRVPVVLCELEGRPRKEVARRLGIPEGTLSSRLAHARKLLARRLTRQGLALSGGALVALLAAGPASAEVPAALLHSTIQAATAVAAGQAVLTGAVSVKVAALCEGVMKAMYLTKLKAAAALLCGAAVLGLGAGGLAYQARAQTGAPAFGAGDKRTEGQEKDRRPAAESERSLRRELEQLRRELAALRAEVEAQRDRAEVEMRRAEAARREVVVQRLRADEQRRRAEAEVREAEEQLRRAQEADKVAPQQNQRLPAQRQGPDGAKVPPAGPGGGQMDRILERLDRLERRLQQLERDRIPSQRKGV
jgi:RNA polymerase sigma factor (sigma-70 family)